MSAAQTGSITLCSKHGKKGDLPAFEGLTAEQEEHHEKCSKAQLGAILFRDSSKHRFFSKQLMKLADPHFVPTPPSSPWRRSKKKQRLTRPLAQSHQAAGSGAEGEEEPQPEELSRDLRDMASFWESDEDEDPMY